MVLEGKFGLCFGKRRQKGNNFEIKGDKMAEKRHESLILTMGTPGNPVDSIYVNRLHVLESAAYGEATLTGDPPVETLHGISFNSSTNKVEFNDTVSSAVTFDSTVTVTGVFTPNGGLTAGSHFTMGTWNISGAGGNVGLGFSGAAATFSSTVTLNGNLVLNAVHIDCGTTGYINDNGASGRGLHFSASGKGTFENSLTVIGSIGSTTEVTATSFIKGSYLQITDGISAPAATATIAKIYVDTSDGKMYGKDGAGNVGLITDFT
jgi:hypothetical protein